MPVEQLQHLTLPFPEKKTRDDVFGATRSAGTRRGNSSLRPFSGTGDTRRQCKPAQWRDPVMTEFLTLLLLRSHAGGTALQRVASDCHRGPCFTRQLLQFEASEVLQTGQFLFSPNFSQVRGAKRVPQNGTPFRGSA